MSDDLDIIRAKLLGSFLLFTQTFFKLRTQREFEISEPIGRESHHLTISRELTRVARGETQRLIINVPPRNGKSEFLIHFVAWGMARFPDSNFLYISYSHELAAKHTSTIKDIMSMPYYRTLFHVDISQKFSAKDNFKTMQGGSVHAFGSAGAITGQDAGLPNLDRFSGAVIMDDMHKPDEVFSDSLREKVIENYKNTIKPRLSGPKVPMIFIGQRLHEADLPAYLIDSRDGYNWNKVILKGIDDAGNVLNPKVHPKEMLEIERKTNPYVFSSQYQQDPQPAGGAIFKKEWWYLLDKEPEIIATFITCDSAETDKDYNDATVFAFWGIYKLQEANVNINLTGLHLIDCVELRCEPKDLLYEFNQFYASCLNHKIKPLHAAIEKKSTGVTLISVLKEKRGLQIIEIERTRASGSKTARFLEIQSYVASKRVSLLSHGNLWKVKDNKLENMFIEHMAKITANDSHAHDDIADVCYDAVKIGLIDDVIMRGHVNQHVEESIMKKIASNDERLRKLKERAYAR